MTARNALLLAAAALALGSCGKKDAQAENSAAGGEVLPRSVTDDMPPYDTIRSQAPLATPEATGLPSSRARTAPEASQAAAEGEDGTSEDAGEEPVVTSAD